MHLGNIGDKEATMPLINALLQDKIFNVRYKAAIALCKLGDSRALKP